MREAGAAARALLSKAAAERWDVDWDALDTRAGFVVNGDQPDTLRFLQQNLAINHLAQQIEAQHPRLLGAGRIFLPRHLLAVVILKLVVGNPIAVDDRGDASVGGISASAESGYQQGDRNDRSINLHHFILGSGST